MNKPIRAALCALLALALLSLPLAALAEGSFASLVSGSAADAADDLDEDFDEDFDYGDPEDEYDQLDDWDDATDAADDAPDDALDAADGAPEAPDAVDDDLDDLAEAAADAAPDAAVPVLEDADALAADAPREDDLSGIWSAMVSEDAVVLELRADGSCTLEVGKSAYEANWVQEASIAYLEKNGVVIPIRWDDAGITITVNDRDLQMTRVDTELLGVWTASTEDKPASLELKANGTCVMANGSSLYTVAWRREGDSVILSREGHEITATYDGSVISLPMGGFALRFARQAETAAPVPTPAP